MNKTKMESSSTGIGIVAAAVFLGVVALFIAGWFAPPTPPNHNITVTFDDRDYVDGFIATKSYYNLVKNYNDLYVKYCHAVKDSDRICEDHVYTDLIPFRMEGSEN